MQKPTPRLIAALAVAPLLALSLAACQDGDADAGDEAIAADTPATETETDTGTETESAEGGEETGADTGSAAAGAEVNAGDSTSSVVASDYLGDYSLSNDATGTMVTVTIDGETRTIQTNSLPDHETGDFPNAGNPNTISAQDISLEYTTAPVYTGGATFAQQPGVAVNGIAFEPGTAETITCTSGETSRIEAIQELYDLGLDFNNAHVQPTGQYHYHGVAELLVDAYSNDEDLVHIGFAADGFLMYYSKSGAYESSYVLADEPRTGTDCTTSGAAGGITIDLAGTTPDGAYDTDWTYTEFAGALDECNGTTIDGEYVYLLTDTYPYISRCLNGEVAGGGGPGGGGAPPGQGAEQGEEQAQDGPDFTEAAAALGITVEELEAALGGPPPDFDAAADALGITVEELQAVLPDPGGVP